MNCHIIKVTHGLSADDGCYLFKEMAKQYNSRMDGTIVLDFSNLELYTTAFLYNSIGKFILLYGEDEFIHNFTLAESTNTELKSIISQILRKIRYVQLQSLEKNENKNKIK